MNEAVSAAMQLEMTKWKGSLLPESVMFKAAADSVKLTAAVQVFQLMADREVDSVDRRLAIETLKLLSRRPQKLILATEPT